MGLKLLLLVGLLVPSGGAKLGCGSKLGCGPPPGAVYHRTVRLPVIGRQTVRLSIVSTTKATLQLQGALNIDEPVAYRISSTGELSFELTDATQAVLKRFRTSLIAAGFDPDTDGAYVIVWPPLPIPIRIRLYRLLADEKSRRAFALTWPTSRGLRWGWF